MSASSLVLHFDCIDHHQYLVSSPELSAHGVGDCPLDALMEWWSQVEDLYEELLASEEVLGDDLKRQLALLKTINGVETTRTTG